MTASSPMAYCLAEGGKIKQMNVDEKRIAESIKPLKIKYTIFNSIVAILAIGCFGWLLPISTLSDNPRITMVVFFVSMSIILIFSIPARETKKEYLKGYKQLITRPVMEALFDEVYYYPDMGYSLEQFRKTGLIPWKQKPSYYVSDNLIRGTYKGVKFKQCDIEIRLNDEDTTKDIKGSLIEFSLSKRVESAVMVLESGVPRPESKFRKVNMENIEFNRMFDVYAIDEHDAFYVLTPHFMEYIQALNGIYRNVNLKFEAENLYFFRSGEGIAGSASLMGKVDIHKEIANAIKEQGELRRIIKILESNMPEKEEALKEVRQEEKMLQELWPQVKKRLPLMVFIMVLIFFMFFGGWILIIFL